MRTVRGFGAHDARNHKRPLLRFEQRADDMFVVYRSDQKPEEGVELRPDVAIDLARWILKIAGDK